MNSPVIPNKTRYEEILRAYYRAWFRFHPEWAVEAGVPGYADRLAPYAQDDRGALVCLNDELLVSLDELASFGLDADQQLDRQILYDAARLENEQLLDIEPTRPDPARFMPINAIYQLLIRPLEDFPGSLCARLKAIPEYLNGAREYLAPLAAMVPPLWARSALAMGRAGDVFLQNLPSHPKVSAHRQSLSDLDEYLRAAVTALRAFSNFLEEEVVPVAQGDFACGRIYFEHLLQRRHYLDVSAERLRAFGRSLFDETQRELKALCRELSGSDDVHAFSQRLRAEHPTQADLLSVYQTQMQAAHTFVAEHDLVSLPPRSHLEVVETPVFLRHQIPFAAYSQPTPGDPQQQGYYYVTPPVDDAQLAEHNTAGLMHTCVHEAWPGHHLQFATANHYAHARSLPRLLNPSATFYEGWALYCEQLMQEQGFLHRPEQRFILLKDRLWRALRILIDVDLHTGALSLQDAAERMVQTLGFPRSQALADLTWYSRAPTVPMGYASGWALILATRERLQQGHADFTLKSFHDRLLSQGSIALPLVIRRVFGESVWSAAKRKIFEN